MFKIKRFKRLQFFRELEIEDKESQYCRNSRSITIVMKYKKLGDSKTMSTIAKVIKKKVKASIIVS